MQFRYSRPQSSKESLGSEFINNWLIRWVWQTLSRNGGLGSDEGTGQGSFWKRRRWRSSANFACRPRCRPSRWRACLRRHYEWRSRHHRVRGRYLRASACCCHATVRRECWSCT